MKKIIFLVLIALFFLLARIPKLSEVPSSLYWDEASIGYNAYTISKNLHDEWGDQLPIHFRAFGEFKLPVYIYSVAAVTKVIGPGLLAVRLPAVFYSLGLVLLIYLIVKGTTKNQIAALLSAFYLTISPWFFIFSRTGYEVTAGLFFFSLGIYFALRGAARHRYFVFSTVALILSAYSYNSFRVLAPLMVLISTVYFFKGNKLKKTLLVPIFVSIVLLVLSFIPIYRLYTLDQGAVRLTTVAAGKRAIVSNYISHFSPKFLFEGDTNSRSQVPGFGEIFILDIPIFLFGLYFLLRKKYTYGVPLIILFLASFVPASLTRESPHALRSLPAVIFLAIFWGVGLSHLSEKFRNYRDAVIVGVVLLTLVFFESYTAAFFGPYNTANSQDWQYGYKKIFEDFGHDMRRYEKVIVSDEYAQPYIFALYYQKHSPKNFLETVEYNTVDKWGFSTVKSFDNFEFRKPEVMDVGAGHLVLSDKLLGDLIPDREIKFLNGEVAFYEYGKK